MNILEYLQRIGYSSNEINNLIKSNQIIVSDNGYYINDYYLLLSIIDNYFNDNYIFDYHNQEINLMVNQLFRLIKLKQNKLAYELALRIYDIYQISEVKLVIDNIDKEYDPLNYILDDGIYPSDVTNEGLKAFERSMLLDFLTGNERDGNDKMIKLAKIYVYQNPNVFITYRAYLTSIVDLEKNHTHVNVRKDASALGEPIGVLCALLKCKDYYRSHKVLKDVYLNHIEEEFSVAWEIFRIYDTRVMQILHRNEENVYKQMELNSNGLNTINEITKDYDLSRINKDLIVMMNKKEDFSIDENVNYYNEYLKHKEEGNYKEARLDIIKHKRRMDEMSIFSDYDYLIKESDILIYNDIYTSDEDKVKHKELMNLAEKAFNNNDYQNAIIYLVDALNYEAKRSPTTYTKIAECYLELGDYNSASLYYETASRDFLFPIDYLHYIECLYYLGKYDEIFPLADAYEYYYPDESAFVHYILSICYLNRDDFIHAIKEIELSEIICMEYYDLALNFNYEKNIIKDIERGKDIPMYTLNDYYDHCFTESTLRRIEALTIDSYEEDGSLLINIINSMNNERIEDQLNFLLKVSKVLKEMERNKDALDLLKYIEELIKNTDLSPTDNEHFTLVLKNYRKL